MAEKEERRRPGVERRQTKPAEFPLQDQQGNWIVTERRVEDRRAADREAEAHARSMARIQGYLFFLLLLALFVVLIRAEIFTAPSWLPRWVIYPEYLLNRLLGVLGSWTL